MLQYAEEDRCVFDDWRDDVMIADEGTVPKDKPVAKFNVESFSDSSWVACKATQRSANSGLVFDGAMVLSACRTQASVAVSSCEAELYAANGLMVEALYLYPWCKFLCEDDAEGN